jgi:hypothetical protein
MSIDTNTCTATFDSLSELVEWLESTPRADGAGKASEKTDYSNWDHGCGYSGALEYARGKVWKDGQDAMVKGTAHATAMRKPAQVPQLGYDVAGFLPDVPAYLAGDPDHMLSVTDMADAQSSKPVVSIALSGFSAGCSDQAMTNRGVAFMSLVDALEDDGYRCEVYFASSIDNGPGRAAHLKTCIKKAADHWNPATAAFALAHPAMFRRFWFAAMERFECVNGATNGGYGQCVLADPDQYTFSVGYQVGDGAYRTLDGALREVQTMAQRKGFEVSLIKD